MLIFSLFQFQLNAQYDVEWGTTKGFSVSNNNLTKTANSGWGTAGATSKNVLTGDGWVEYVVSSGIDDMIGFSSNYSGTNYETIDFAIHPNSGNDLYIYERGANKGPNNNPVGTYKNGDKIRVERVGSSIYYKKNGTTIYTSTNKFSGNLKISTTTYHKDRMISDVKASFAIPGQEGNKSYDVVWTDLEGVSVINNSLVKTSPESAWKAGAASKNKLLANENGWVECTATLNNTHRILGLSSTNKDAASNTIGFGIYIIADGRIFAIEDGTDIYKPQYKPLTMYREGDIMRVERINSSTIVYKQNGTIFYTSNKKYAGELIVDVSLYEQNAIISNPKASFAVPNQVV
jgi:hypothetical protein